MVRSRRLVGIAAAWAAPLIWVAVVLASGPSDGTRVTAPAAVVSDARWADSILVVAAYGDTPLDVGDRVLAVDGRTVEQWFSQPASGSPAVGDVATYRVRRPAAGLDRILEVEVPLAAYPVGAALRGNLHLVVLTVALLTSGSVLVWRRSRERVSYALLALGVAVAAGATAHPLGLGVIDLAGGPRLWPHLAGEVALAVGAGLLLLVTLTLPEPSPWLRTPVGYLLPLVVPAAAYGAWVSSTAFLHDRGPARLQALLTIAAPAFVAVALLLPAALAHGYVRTRSPERRIAVRLVIVSAAAATIVGAVLAELPRQLTGGPLVPWRFSIAVLGPAVLACLVTAVLGFHLHEVDATVRRTFVQVVVATVVGGVFLVAAEAVTRASGTPRAAMVAGGVVALVLLPVALSLRRGATRLMYGDRAFPSRVVTELRRLDPSSAPEQALDETLAILQRRLRLSAAAVKVFDPATGERIEVDRGERRGEPTTVMLDLGGATVGRLELEVSPMRDPFGARDRRLLEDLGSQVGSLVQALLRTRELQRSRERLVAAREEERRRLRRDLHDGLGPSLAALAMRLEVARDLIAREPDEASRLVGQAAERTRSEIREVRRLVDGLRPPALDQLGLVAALRQRAEEHNHAAGLQRDGRRMQWRVQAPDDLGDLPAAVEVAAYRIAQEAVANALHHSRSETCVVTVGRGPGVLELVVEDAGVGLAEPRRAGVGLESMRERAEELGGTCTFLTSEGDGTRVVVRLPWEDDASKDTGR